MDHERTESSLPTGEHTSLAQGLLAELNQTLERARDERFRLIRLVKDCESRLAHAGVAPSQDTLEKLLTRVEQLNDAVRTRFDKLAEVDRNVDKRLEQLNRLESGIREFTTRFTDQVAKARNFDRDVLDARHRIEAEAAAVSQGLQAQIAEAQARFGENAAHLEQLAQSLTAQQAEADRVVAQTAGMIQRQVERAARETRQHIDGAVAPVAGQVRDLVDGAAARVQQAVTGGMQTLLEQAEQVLVQARADVQATADQMSDALAGELQQQIDTHRQTFSFRDAALRDELEARMAEREQQLKAEVEEHLCVLVEQARERMRAEIQTNIDAVRAEAEGAVDRVSGMMTSRAGQVVAAAEKKSDELAEAWQQRLAAALEHADRERDQVGARLDERVAGFKGMAEEEVTAAIAGAQEKLRQLVFQAMSKADSMIEPFTQRLKATLDTHRDQIEEIVATQEHADEDRERALRQRITAALTDLRERTETLQRDLIAHARHAVKPVEAALRQTMADTRAEVEQQLAQHAAALRPQVEADLGAVEALIKSRLSQLRGDAESMVELMERQLEKRIAAMEERAMQTSHAAEKGVRERLERMRTEVEETLAPLRRQTAAELERITEASRALRVTPRTAPAADGPEREVTTLPIIDSTRLADSLHSLGSRVRRDAETSADQAA